MEHLHYKKKDGTVVSGDENRLEQTKYNVEVMYIQDEKLAITPINLKVWTLHRFYEVDYNHV